MRRPIIIGDRNFKTKKSAKEYFSKVLNSYNFGESLSDEHYHDLINLLKYYLEDKNRVRKNENIENNTTESNDKIFIDDIRIAKFQFNTKCFEFVPSKGEPVIISYRIFVDKPKINEKAIFNKVCRNTIQSDLIKVKQDYFKVYSKNSKAPCQETKKNMKYEDLVVDHRQPNTLSVIVDRFIELNKIEFDKVEYKTEPNKLTEFKDLKLSSLFREYHKEKALLRVVDKNLNLSRSGMARLKQMKDDLKINN